MERGIECRRLTVARRTSDGREKLVIDDLSAQFETGQMAVISGATGSGKSTLLHVLAGLLRPIQGEVVVDGEAVSRWVSSHRDPLAAKGRHRFPARPAVGGPERSGKRSVAADSAREAVLRNAADRPWRRSAG